MGNKLKVRKLFILLILSGWLIGNAQTSKVSSTKNTSGSFKDQTKLPTNYAKWKNNLIPLQNLVSTLKHDTCINKKFSIVFYLIQDSSNTFSNPVNLNTIITNTINPLINILNNEFKKICVSFQNCSTVVIPNYQYNLWSQNLIEPIVTSNWYTAKTINLYLPTSFSAALTPSASAVNNNTGYTYMPGTPGNNKDIIVMTRGLASAPTLLTNTVTLFHLVGHFFGLPNTQDEIGPAVVPGPIAPTASYEYFDRTNCYTNGDGFCDTEADCFPAGAGGGLCGITYGPVDGLGKYYTPPIDNFMSEYVQTCRCKYTQEQWNFMAKVMITSKFYLH